MLFILFLIFYFFHRDREARLASEDSLHTHRNIIIQYIQYIYSSTVHIFAQSEGEGEGEGEGDGEVNRERKEGKEKERRKGKTVPVSSMELRS